MLHYGTLQKLIDKLHQYAISVVSLKSLKFAVFHSTLQECKWVHWSSVLPRVQSAPPYLCIMVDIWTFVVKCEYLADTAVDDFIVMW